MKSLEFALTATHVLHWMLHVWWRFGIGEHHNVCYDAEDCMCVSPTVSVASNTITNSNLLTAWTFYLALFSHDVSFPPSQAFTLF